IVWFVLWRQTTESFTLSLHDALPIWGGADTDGEHRSHGSARGRRAAHAGPRLAAALEREPLVSLLRLSERRRCRAPRRHPREPRSEEHTSELQSRSELVCRLLLEKKK